MTDAEYVEQVVAEAPPLTDDQRSRLTELLRPARTHVGRMQPIGA